MKSADIIIVGAGALGTALAYNLAIRSNLSIALLDSHQPGSQTSPRAAGMVSLLRKSASMIRLIKRARVKIETFTRDLDQPLMWENSGSLKIARRPEDDAVLDGDLKRAIENGLNVERISPDEGARLNPFLRPEGITGILHIHDDCYFEPQQIATGYAAAAVRHGVHLLPNTPAIDIVTSRNKVVGVKTPRGQINTPYVVDAAGAWSRQIAAKCRIDLPLIPTRHQAIITEPLDGASAKTPMVRIMDAAVYTRTYGKGLLWGVFEENPRTLSSQDLDSSFDTADLSLDLSIMKAAAKDVREQLPVLEKVGVATLRGGLPTMTPDGRHLLGPSPGLDGFYFASGCNVAGLSIAPAIGEGMASWILEGTPPSDFKSMHADRFAEAEDEDEADVVANCRKQYRHFYGSA
ncbi:NAD(P)/FAD-dependent oxidoreductase [Denitrobaculum tricleocarpae]|uniref:FAD-binding oxidoreductase n=1 Tax=Denitrobaculum tricleocarpae TaxID=2591009 RepID=A0A545U1J2_9PROT|nr:FAD-binding oxidoreductase [Denitrobaculum tricleocarpae]TQV83316.1 FAD-binding oxidoreductase [Denitrobaculum tricleocarpae]